MSLFRLGSRVVAPGMDGLMPQPTFSLLDVPDNLAVVGAASASGFGALASQGQLLAAIALEDYMRRMPLVGPGKRVLADLVVSLDTHSDSRHSLTPSPAARPSSEGL